MCPPRAAAARPLVVAALLALAACGRDETPLRRPSVALAPCHLSAPGLTLRVAARCGTVTVPEDPNAPEGRKIGLRVAVVPALNRRPRPDPLVWLAGGPGQAATEVYAYTHGALAEVNRDRDIVLVDQRGTGASNGLHCPDLGTEADLGELSDKALAGRVDDCRTALEARADLRRYTTALAVDDLDLVREKLGYDQVNLYGISYGSRAALSYLRRHPEHVRAVVLDGVAPPDLPLGRDLARDAQHALEVVLARCRGDSACAAAFPALPTDFEGLNSALATEPAKVTLAHPVTGEATDLTLGGQSFGQAVRLLSYAPETVALLPYLIHSAAARKDYAGLAAQALMTGEQLADTIADGMGNTVVCSEDLPFFTQAEAAASARGSYLGDSPARLLALTCAHWPRAELPADQREPVRSDAPVLLLSGEADPVTPPANAAHAAETLPNSRQIVAPGQGHGVLTRGCVPKLVAEFVESGSAASLDTACVEALAGTPFFVRAAGSEP